jgi:hypothetical protein
MCKRRHRGGHRRVYQEWSTLELPSAGMFRIKLSVRANNHPDGQNIRSRKFAQNFLETYIITIFFRHPQFKLMPTLFLLYLYPLNCHQR